jgi:hypothetical protein
MIRVAREATANKRRGASICRGRGAYARPIRRSHSQWDEIASDSPSWAV